MKKPLLAFVALFILSGCSVNPKVKAGKAGAKAPIDPGTPASASASSSVATLPVPAGSTVETVPETPATASNPAVPASVKVVLAAPSELRVESHGEAASTGTVDSTVAVKKAELAQASKDRAPLLWVAIGCGILGMLALGFLKEWPIVGRSLLGASVLAGVAWKLAEVPWWAFAVVLGIGGLAIAFYKRAEWDANKDGIPDALQKPGSRLFPKK